MTVLWLPKEHWADYTSLPYGFPSNSAGREILAAADIDHPDELARLVNVLSVAEMQAEELSRLAQLQLSPTADSSHER